MTVRVTTSMPADLAARVTEWAKARGMSRAAAVRELVPRGMAVSGTEAQLEDLKMRGLKAKTEEAEGKARKRVAEAMAAEADVYRRDQVLEMLGETCGVFRGELRGMAARFGHLLEGAGVPTEAARVVLRDIEDRLVAGVADALAKGSRDRNGEGA